MLCDVARVLSLLLFVDCCVLFVDGCLLFAVVFFFVWVSFVSVRCELCVVAVSCYLSFAVLRVMFVVYCSSFWCLLFLLFDDGRCSLLVGRRSLFVGSCLLFVVHCLLFVACCLL